MLGIFLARGLGYTANSWATWKEGRPFATLVMARLRVRIEHPAGDLRKNAIPFILLHEFGHVLTAGAGCLPDWWAAPATLGPPERYPCLAPSWTIDALRNIVPADPAHHAVYNGLARAALRRADAEHALGLYQALQATAWPSLYAANYPYDDFAECFALYLHTWVLGRRTAWPG